MSVEQITLVFRHSQSKGSARLVLLALADVSHETGEVSAYPRSHKRLAEKANIDPKTVPRALAALVDLGEIQVVKAGHGRASSDYLITLGPQPADREARGQTPQNAGSQTPQDAGSESAPRGAHHSVLDPSMDPSSSVARADPFDEWWSAYPRKTAKPAARRAWPKAVERAGDAGVLIARARQWREAHARADPKRRKFTPHPATWLNGDRWNDDPFDHFDVGAAGPHGRISQDRDRPSGRIDL